MDNGHQAVAGYEGPRGAQPQDMNSLRRLLDEVFRPGMMDEYPQLFQQPDMDNLRVCVRDGEVVSHVGMTIRTATLFGCPIRVCCIGAVGTLPPHRKHGLASASFDDAVRHAGERGVDLMIVSGSRNLYSMRGCVHVGRNIHFALTTSEAAALPAPWPGMDVDVMQAGELKHVMEIYRREPVRWMRPAEDYAWALQSRRAMDRPVEFQVVRDGGAIVAYVISCSRPEREACRLVELAGDRHALLCALPLILRRSRQQRIRWPVQRHDTLLQHLCFGAGLRGEPSAADGTYKLVNYPQLMEKLRPRWEELLGHERAAGLEYQDEGGERSIALGPDKLTLDRDGMTRLLFGQPDEPALPHGARRQLAAALKEMLPIPTVWYGINYV